MERGQEPVPFFSLFFFGGRWAGGGGLAQSRNTPSATERASCPGLRLQVHLLSHVAGEVKSLSGGTGRTPGKEMAHQLAT